MRETPPFAKRRDDLMLPLWKLGAAAHACQPGWLLLACGALVLGLFWRAAGWVPDLTTLCTGLSAAYWLAALWLADALRRVAPHAAAARSGNDAVLRTVTVAALLPSLLLLAVAPLGVLLAFDPTRALFNILAQDTGPITITTPGFIVRCVVYAAPAFIAAAAALLLLLRRLAGFRAATCIWLLLGVALHCELLTAQLPLRATLTFAGMCRYVASQLGNTDLMQLRLITEPLTGHLALCWTAALALLAVASALPPAVRQRVPALATALSCGLVATSCFALQSAALWLVTPGRLAAGEPGPLVTLFAATTASVYAAINLWQRREPHWIGRELPLLLPASAAVFILGLPLVVSAVVDSLTLLLIVLLMAAMLLLLIALAATLQRACAAPENGSAALPGGGALAALAVMLLLLYPLSDASGAVLGELAAALADAQLRPLALAVTALLAGIAALLVWLDRRGPLVIPLRSAGRFPPQR